MYHAISHQGCGSHVLGNKKVNAYHVLPHEKSLIEKKSRILKDELNLKESTIFPCGIKTIVSGKFSTITYAISEPQVSQVTDIHVFYHGPVAR